MTPDDAIRYRPIISSGISRDGRWAVVAVPELDAARESRPLAVHVADLDEEEPRFAPLALKSAADATFGPSFAPDSERLAVFCARGVDQEVVIFELQDDKWAAGEPSPVPPGASALKWRGEPGRLACIGQDAEGWSRVFAWPGETLGEPEPLSPPEIHIGDYALRPDGAELAWLHCPDYDDPDSERLPIHVGPTEGGPFEAVRVPGRPVGYLSWSPDGRWLAYMARRTGQRLSSPQLWIVDPARWPTDPDSARCLSRGLEGSITGYDWCPDSQGVVVSIVEGVACRLRSIHVADGTSRPVGPAGAYTSGPHLDRSEGRLLHLHQDSHRPQRLCLLEPGAPHSRPLSRFHRRPTEASSARQATVCRWTATDGQALEGLVLRPADAEGPAPLLVWLHGGPAEGIARTFSPYFQVFAAAGFAVFTPNYRGSTGYSDAFLRSNVGDLGGADCHDVLGGLDRLVQLGVADPERTLLVGWSYGGTLALRIAELSSIPTALVVGAPVVDWVAFFGATRLPALYGEYFPTPLWEAREGYDAASPITHIRDLDAPTLVLHGAADSVVPPSQSRLLYRALKARGVPTDLMVYPGEGHVPARPSAVTDMLGRIVAWGQEHLGVRRSR